MDINERIKKIGQYFAVFNVHEGNVCIGVSFPEKWTLFDIETICEEFDIEIQSKDGITFFVGDVANGFEHVFDAVDFIIEQNRALEEKTGLLLAKVEELKKLFETQSLDNLKRLRFTFEDEVIEQAKSVSLPVDIKKQLRKGNKTMEDKVETVPVVAEPSEEPISDQKEVKTTKKTKKKSNSNDSSLMSYVKNNL